MIMQMVHNFMKEIFRKEIEYYENEVLRFNRNYVNGYFYGRGVFYNINRNKKNEGDFVNNLINGNGAIYVGIEIKR